MHLGVILPDDGPQSYEWYALLPWLAACGAADVRVSVAGSDCDGMHTVESLFATGSVERLAPVAKRLAARGCQAVMWACTSGSFIGGRRWAAEQAGALARSCGRPAGSTALALVEAARALGTDAVDLLSPYPADVGERLVVFLEQSGVGVRQVRHLDCLRSSQSHGLDLRAEVGRFGRTDDTRPLLVPDTAVDSLGLVEELEELAGRPVVTANQATLWAGLGLLGARRPLRAAGTLFRTSVPAPAAAG